MKYLSVGIPENKFDVILQFLKTVEYLQIEEENDSFYIPEEHKKMVLERVATAKSEDYISLDEAKKMIR